MNAGDTLSVPAPGPLGNDSDPDGDPLRQSLFTISAHGVIGSNADGSFTYTPDAGFSGTDYFTYLAIDPDGK